MNLTQYYSQWKEKIFAWYREHSAGEQRIITALAILFIFCITYYGVWAPVKRTLQESHRAYAEQQELLRWMRANLPLARQASSSMLAYSAQTPLPTLLTDMAKAQGITIKRLETDESGKASVSFEHVPFNRLVVWMDLVERGLRLTQMSLSLSKTDAPGLVNATIQLKN